MERIEDCISFLVGKAVQTVTRRTRERLQQHEVTPVQFGVLQVLWESDGLRGVEIAARLRLDSATVTGVLDRLEKQALLRRQPDPDDRRVQRLFLTDLGQAMRQPLQNEMNAVNAEIAEAMGVDAPQLWSLLRRLGDLDLDREVQRKNV